jgi:uncharacterized protein YodC (DUF2158 family)
MRFLIGDKAILNSGGPVMEIIGISRNGRVWCEWKRRDGYIDEASFDQAMLTKV